MPTIKLFGQSLIVGCSYDHPICSLHLTNSYSWYCSYTHAYNQISAITGLISPCSLHLRLPYCAVPSCVSWLFLWSALVASTWLEGCNMHTVHVLWDFPMKQIGGYLIVAIWACNGISGHRWQTARISSLELVSPASPIAVSGFSDWRAGTVILVICRKVCDTRVKRSVSPLRSRNPPGFRVFTSLFSLFLHDSTKYTTRVGVWQMEEWCYLRSTAFGKWT